MEDVRLVEDTALKAAGCNRLVGSIPMSSAIYVGYSRVVLRFPVKEEGSGQNRLVTPNKRSYMSKDKGRKETKKPKKAK